MEHKLPSVKKRAPLINPRCRQLFQIAKAAADRTFDEKGDRESRDDGDALIAIVFAFSALEGFLNELPEIILSLHDTSLAFVPMPDPMLRLAACLSECEWESSQMPLKLAAWHSVVGKTFNRSEWEDLLLLRDVRNALVHYHGETAVDTDSPGSHPNPFDLEGRDRRLVQRMRAKKVLADVAKPERVPLLELLQTRKVAIWAIDTADKSIFTLLRMLPTEGDLLDYMTMLFAFLGKEKQQLWVQGMTEMMFRMSRLSRSATDKTN